MTGASLRLNPRWQIVDTGRCWSLEHHIDGEWRPVGACHDPDSVLVALRLYSLSPNAAAANVIAGLPDPYTPSALAAAVAATARRTEGKPSGGTPMNRERKYRKGPGRR